MSKIQTPHEFKCDLDVGSLEVKLREPLMHQDSLADVFRVRVLRNGKELSLSGMVARGLMYSEVTRKTIPLPGVVEGSFASVTLIDKCYAVPGEATLSIQLQEGDVCHTLANIHFDLRRTGTNDVTDPAGVLPTLPVLLSKITALEQTTDEARQTISDVKAEGDEAVEQTMAAAADARLAAQEITGSSASPIRKSATGKCIELNNAADKPLAGLKLYGRTTQATTKGKNLINTIGASGGTSAGITVTVNADGSYTINGTATDINVNVWFAGYFDANAPTLFVLPAGTYYVAGIALYSGTSLVSGSYQIAGSFFTLAEDTPITGVRCTFVTSGQTYTNRTVYPIVAAGTEAVEWEPYTGCIPGPNPDYPLPLMSPGDSGSIGVKALGKNLLNVPSVININSETADAARVFPIPCNLPAGTYTFSIGGYAPDNNGAQHLVFYYIGLDGTEVYPNIQTHVHNTHYAATFTAASGINWCAVYVPVADDTYTVRNLMLEVGSIATEYEPYKNGGNVVLSTPNGLPGVPVISGNYVDENGQMWLCDEIDLERGVYVKNVKLFSLSQVASWSQWGAHWYNHNYLNDSLATYNAIFGYCSHVRRNDGIAIDTGYIAHSEVANGYGFGIQINSAAEKWGFTGSTAEEFKSFIDAKDIKLVYACHPIETPLSAEELASYRAMSTFDPYTVVYSDSDVEMTVDYIGETEKFVHEVIDDRTAPPIVETASGSITSVNDSSNRPLKGLRLYGKTTQATTTGKNLLPNTVSTTVNNGITFVAGADGTITANGTSMVDYDAYCIVGTATLVVGEKYLLTGCPSGGGFGIGLDGTGIYDWGDGIEFTAETANYTPVLIVSKNKTISNIVFKPMIRLASVTDANYEPYTGGISSPNPNYPQELVNVGDGGSIEVYSRGNNLLNIAQIVQSSTKDGLTLTSLGNGFSISGTATKDSAWAYALDKPIPAGRYEYRARNAAASATNTLYLMDADGIDIGHIPLNSTYNKTIVSTDKPITHLKMYIRSGTSPNLTMYPQLVVEGAPTEYELFKDGGSVTASTPNGLPGIPVSSGGNYTDGNGQQWLCDEIYFERGVYVQRVGVRKLNGTETWYTGTTLDGRNNRYSTPISDKMSELDNATVSRVLCDAYPAIIPNEGYMGTVDYGVQGQNDTVSIIINDAQYPNQDLDGFKAALAASPITVMYVLATPIETPLSASELAAYHAMTSQKPNTTFYNDAGADMAIDYIADTKAYIDKKLAAIAAALIEQ